MLSQLLSCVAAISKRLQPHARTPLAAAMTALPMEPDPKPDGAVSAVTVRIPAISVVIRVVVVVLVVVVSFSGVVAARQR